METDQIYALCSGLIRGSKFLNVYPRDLIPKSFSVYPCCFIANTDLASGPGIHWVAYYISDPSQIEFFDSFGYSPDYYQFNLSANLCNSIQIQSDISNFCGHYSIYYLIQRSLQIPLPFISHQFSSNYELNDKSIEHFILPFLYSNVPRHSQFCQCCISPYLFKITKRLKNKKSNH